MSGAIFFFHPHIFPSGSPKPLILVDFYQCQMIDKSALKW